MFLNLGHLSARVLIKKILIKKECKQKTHLSLQRAESSFISSLSSCKYVFNLQLYIEATLNQFASYVYAVSLRFPENGTGFLENGTVFQSAVIGQ